jgi:hypothetical protein
MIGAAYFDLAAAQHKLRISKENSDSYQATLNAADKRKKSGILLVPMLPGYVWMRCAQKMICCSQPVNLNVLKVLWPYS